MSGNLTAFRETDGVAFAPDQLAAGLGCLLPAGTYYVPIADALALKTAIDLMWDALLAGVFTFESTDLDDATYYEPSATGKWTEENPATAYVGIDAVNVALGAGTKIAWAALTGTLTAGVVGSSMIHLSDFAATRLRVKIVVTTQGHLRVVQSAKGGS